MKDLLNTHQTKAIRKSDYFEPLTQKRDIEKSKYDSVASECRYSVGTTFNY